MIKDLLCLFCSFFYVGLFTIGGGYAMLPLLEKEIVDKYEWLTHEELLDVFALGQSTPGIIALNVSTFVGVRQRGILGGIAATGGMIVPSLIIIISAAYFIQGINKIPIVKSVFSGIRVVVAALLVGAVYSMGRKAIKDFFGLAIVIIGFVLMTFGDVSPIWVVLGGGICGVLLYGCLGMHSKKIGGK